MKIYDKRDEIEFEIVNFPTWMEMFFVELPTVLHLATYSVRQSA